MTVPNDSRTNDDIINSFAATLPWPLDDFQREALHTLESHRGVVVSAPTSSGKTVIADYLIWRCVNRAPSAMDSPSRVMYTTPLKALSNQKFHDFCRQYGAHNVGLITGEHTINDAAPIVVATTEVLRNMIYDDSARLDLVSDIILDEIHYIDDYPRGTVWEEIIILAPLHVRMTGLSATVSNVHELTAWMSSLRGDVGTVVRHERPVELRLWLAINNQLLPFMDAHGHPDRATIELAQRQEIADPKLRYLQRAPDNDLIKVIEQLNSREMVPAIYFIFSRRGCRDALSRCAIHGLDLTNATTKTAIAAAYNEHLLAIADDDERAVFHDVLNIAVLQRGFGMHHAGMLPSAKEAVEHLLKEGLLKVVFATETLSLGLNMPARSCVVSSFTKFDGTGFVTLNSGQLTQLMGRAGRRGIDTIGHGVVLKEFDVDVAEIYEAALGTEMPVVSKFAPTYTMTLNLLKTNTVEQAEELIERSFGQYQSVTQAAQWENRESNLREQLDDLRKRVFRHPRIPCTERTLTQYLQARSQVDTLQTQVRRSRRDHWRDSRRGRFGGRNADPGQQYEAARRSLRAARNRTYQSPCYNCPFFAEHNQHRSATHDIQYTLKHGKKEAEAAQHQYRNQFQAFRNVLSTAGFLHDDKPTALGTLAASLYGESALIIARALAENWFAELTPPELAATLVMLVAEDRGPERGPRRYHFPTATIDSAARRLRTTWREISQLEQHNALNTLRPLSLDFVDVSYRWTLGDALPDITPPPDTDLGDVVKAMKNLYSMLRQMEVVTARLPIRGLIMQTREHIERDLIRRV